jgi:hypothetical protein
MVAPEGSRSPRFSSSQEQKSGISLSGDVRTEDGSSVAGQASQTTLIRDENFISESLPNMAVKKAIESPPEDANHGGSFEFLHSAGVSGRENASF